MPWRIDSHHADCNGFAVVKESDGSVAGCHDTRTAAENQLAALYANEPAMAGGVATGPCSCQHPEPVEDAIVAGLRTGMADVDPFGEAFAASVLTAVREPNRAARRAARAGHRARRALQAAAQMPFEAGFPVPLYPPRDWFDGPPNWVEPWRAAAGLRPADDGGILRLTITDEGRIGGWFYNAGQCLVHDPTACPGASPTRYAAFHQSDVLCDDGQMIDCGVIGMTHGHQSPWLDWKEAQRLYADPTAQKILCVAGDDERGGWIAGAVVPGTTYGDVALMRRSGLSGDWRPMPNTWWSQHGITAAAVRDAEGYDCIGPTLVTRPALPLVRNFSVDGRAAAILGGAAGIEFDVSRFSRIDRERIVVLASAEPRGSRFALRAYTAENFDESLVVREHGRFAHKDGGAVEVTPGEPPVAVPTPVEPSMLLHSQAAPGEVDTVLADMRVEATDLMDHAAAAEPEVTSRLESVVAQVDQGSELVGLDFRLKMDEDRIAQKLAEAHAEGLDDAAAKDMIADALRYTVQADPNQYTMTYTQTKDGLIAAGFSPVPGKEKNFWEPGDAYQGFNTQWRSPDGQKFEVQFHTPDSWTVKNEIHGLFQEWRATDDPVVRQRAFDEMARRWDTVEIPDGIMDHGYLVLSGKMASRQAALDQPIRYFRTGQGVVFRERHEDGGMYLELQQPDGTWVHDGALLAYRIGMDTDFDEIPDPTTATQGSVSRFARRSFVEFDETKHPRGEKGRFTFTAPEEPPGGRGIMPKNERKMFEAPVDYAKRLEGYTKRGIGYFDFGVGQTGPPNRVEAVTLPNRVLQYPADVQALVDANPQRSGEEDFAYQGRIIAGLDPQTQSDVIYEMRETYEPVGYIADGMNQWIADRGLDPLPDNLVSTPVDIEEAMQVARFFENATDQSTDPAVREAYNDFKIQNAAMYDFITRPETEGGLGVTVDFSPLERGDPYPTASAQADDLRDNHHITIQSGLGGEHSQTITMDEYDRFRAVHDVFGHAAIGGGFDRHGEYEAWLTHAGMYTDPGRQAMSTEYHAVNSALWSGEPGTPGTGISVLLPEPYGVPPWDRQQPVAAAVVAPEQPDPHAAVMELIRVLGLDESFGQKFDHPEWHIDTGAQQASVPRFARRAYAWDPEAHPRDVGGKFLGIGGDTQDQRREKVRNEVADALKGLPGPPIELRSDISDRDLGTVRAELRAAQTEADQKAIRDEIERKGLNRLTNPEPKQRPRERSLHVPVGPGSRVHPALASVSRYARRAFTAENFDESLVHREHGMFATKDGGDASGEPTSEGGGSSLADKFIKGEPITLPADDVATFTDRLGQWVKDEKDAGRSGVLNMCEVSVPGTNLFCGDALGIPRQEMPQLTGQPIPGSPASQLPRDADGGVNISGGFRDYLRDTLGAKITNDVVPSASLKATQNELRSDKTAGIAEGIRTGKVNLEGGDRIFVSNDGYILDGHHRWAGAILNDLEDGHLGDAKMPIERVDIGILDLVRVANQYATDQGVAQKGLGPEGAPLAGMTQTAATSASFTLHDWTETRMAATKTEAGQHYSSGDYAYVPDTNQPSTWKLRLTATPGGAPDASMVGRAIAAFGGGYRGNKAAIPQADRDKVRSRLRGAWKQANKGRPESEMPDVLARAAAAGDSPVTELRAIAQEFAVGQHRFHVKPGSIMSALLSAAAHLERQEPAKAAPKLDDAVKIVEELEKAQPKALKGMTDRVKAIRDAVAGTKSPAASRAAATVSRVEGATTMSRAAAYDESQHPRDAHGRFMSVGDEVVDAQGEKGTIVDTSKGEVTVRRQDGSTVTAPSTSVSKDVSTTAPDSSAKTDATRATWDQTFASASDALAPYSRTAPDGFQYIDPSAPTALTDMYRSLISVGYANGWLASARSAGAHGFKEFGMDTDIETRYIITFPDGRRADSASIGIRVASLPVVASVTAAGDLPVAPADTPWDEATAKTNLADNAAGDETTYGQAFLFHDDTQQGPDSYYWPIADVVNGEVMVVPAAVDAAMAAVQDGTIGTLTPAEKDAATAILTAYAPAAQPMMGADEMQAELGALRARVNAFDEFMDGYLTERVQAQIASIVEREAPLPTLDEPVPVA